MKFILEYKNYYKEGDIVLIEYWYNHMITPVKIKGFVHDESATGQTVYIEPEEALDSNNEIREIEKQKSSFLVSHNISDSKIQNAPEETIKSSQIISPHRG